MQKDSNVYFEDILGAISRIEEYTSGMTYEEFAENHLVSDAVLRNLGIIGEAIKRIPEDVRKKSPEVEWKKASGLRDLIIHAYSEVDLKIIWDVVANKLPELKDAAKKALGK